MKKLNPSSKTLPQEIGDRYNSIADTYEQNRSLTIGSNYVQKFIRFLPFQGKYININAILDIGCGTGVPLTSQLALSGAKVIGVDISAKMIKKSRINVPNASFIQGNILSTRLNGKFDGVLAWDSLFHIPLSRQEEVIRKIIRLLNTNGIFLFTTGGSKSEVISDMFGKEFYYSSLSVEDYERILLEENLQVVINEMDDTSSYGHRIICCRKI